MYTLYTTLSYRNDRKPNGNCTFGTANPAGMCSRKSMQNLYLHTENLSQLTPVRVKMRKSKCIQLYTVQVYTPEIESPEIKSPDIESPEIASPKRHTSSS